MASTTADNNENNKMNPLVDDDDADVDSLADTSLALSQCDVPLGGGDETPVGDTGCSKVPVARIKCLQIVATFVGIVGIASGVAAGMFTEKSYNWKDDSFEPSDMDVRDARVLGFLSIASFVTAIPMMFCAASLYQKQRSSPCQEQEESRRRGRPGLMTYAWILYGIGIINVVLLVVACMLLPAFSMTFWVYFATLFNVLPFTMMMIHAEAARKY